MREIVTNDGWIRSRLSCHISQLKSDVFCWYHTRKICVFSDDFYSGSILFLTILSMKLCLHVEVRPHMCGKTWCGNVISHWWFVLCRFINLIGVAEEE
jgi:hypothetical protein